MFIVSLTEFKFTAESKCESLRDDIDLHLAPKFGLLVCFLPSCGVSVDLRMYLLDTFFSSTFLLKNIYNKPHYN